MTPTVGIVVVNYNGLADTRECLRSLSAVNHARWFPVVVDNASREDPTATITSEFPGCTVIRRAVNGGWAGGNNAGIRWCLQHHADYVVLLNNDTRVSPRLIERLLAAAEAHPGHGILGPVIRHFDPPCDVQTEGCDFNTPRRAEFFQRRAVSLHDLPSPAVTDVDIVNGCCMMVGAQVFRKIRLIDEQFFLIHEESDFCLRARKAGFRCGVMGETLVWHKGSQSFRRAGLRVQRYYDARNLLRLLSKHGYLPGHRRGRLASLWHYLKYVYARYETERDAGQIDSATAVLEGAADAVLRRFGPYRPGLRPGLSLFRAIFDCRRLSVRRPRFSAAAVAPVGAPS